MKSVSLAMVVLMSLAWNGPARGACPESTPAETWLSTSLGEADDYDSLYVRDEDSDGYAKPGDVCGCKDADIFDTTYTCTDPSVYVTEGTESVLYIESTRATPGDDCDDTNSAVNPGVVGDAYDNVDRDCNGTTCDADGDGHSCEDDAPCCTEDGCCAGGDDCDDANESVFPGASGDEWYDGIDTDCAGNNDFDKDGDTWSSDDECDAHCAESPIATECVTGGVCASTLGYDCDDDHAETYPGAAEICGDESDNDCEGDDGEKGEIDKNTQSGAFFLVVRDDSATVDEGTADSVLVCEVSIEDVQAGILLSNEDYIASRCDDDEFDEALPLITLRSMGLDAGDCTTLEAHNVVHGVGELIFWDGDSDGKVGATFKLCDPPDSSLGAGGLWVAYDFMFDDGLRVRSDAIESANTEVVGGLSTDNLDCDDADSSVGWGLEEICDEHDNDCDCLIDEIPENLTAADVEKYGCVPFYLDADEDGYGAESDTICVCRAQIDDGAYGSGDCPSVEELPDSPIFEDPNCYSPSPDDCADSDFAINPGAGEKLDGANNDCDPWIPVVELDCDEDGSMVRFPSIATAAAVKDLTLGESGDGGDLVDGVYLGLHNCDEPDVELSRVGFTCWEGNQVPLTLRCNAITGMVEAHIFETTEPWLTRYSDGRVLSLNPDAYGDCDDYCADRSPEWDETCDGIDNDCRGDGEGDTYTTLYVDGPWGGAVPRGLIEDSSVHRGFVSDLEIDFDGDLLLACDDGDRIPLRENQYFETDVDCDGGDLIGGGDENNLCSSYATAPDPSNGDDASCDGKVALEGAGATLDVDGDGHQECGPWSFQSPELEEISLLVWVPDSPNGDKVLVPLLLPRVGADECDGDLRSALYELLNVEHEPEILDAVVDVGGDARSALKCSPILEFCLLAERCTSPELAATEDVEEVEEGDPACENIPVGFCATVTLTLDPSAEDDLSYPVGALDGAAEDVDSVDTSLSDSGAGVVDSGTASQECADHPEQQVGRAIWTRERILEARYAVTQLECARLYGTFGCGDLDPANASKIWQRAGIGDSEDALSPSYALISPEGRAFAADRAAWFATQDVDNRLTSSRVRSRWWAELGRYSASVDDGVSAGCWGDPELERQEALSDQISDLTGGDCDQQDVEGPKANRDLTEGPSDPLALFRRGVRRAGYDPMDANMLDCSICLDGIDNNCNGTVDCEDPGCADCFVGQGAPIGCGSESKCTQAGCASRSDRRVRLSSAAVVLVLLVLTGSFARRAREGRA